MKVSWSFSRSGLEMEVDTVNIFGADAWKERHWGGGMEQSEGSCLQAARGQPMDAGGGRWPQAPA